MCCRRRLRLGGLFLVVLLMVVLSACGGGGGGDDGLAGSCAHLSCTPDSSGVVEKVEELLEDGEDGIIDEGESRVGDLLLRWVTAVQEGE